MLLGWPPLLAAVTPISILLTADTEGQVESCQDCPGQQSLGGLSRRATLVTRLRTELSSLLLVDAGNAFFGGESLDGQGKIMVAAYNTLGYDAVNLSYRDFQLGKAAALALLQEAQFAVLSANLRDAESGELLVQPYVVKEVGGKRIALLGVTQSPAGLDALPRLRAQLAGIRIQLPVEALAQWLPKAKDEADDVILLYYGSALSLQPIRERFGAGLAAILVGGSRPEYLPAESTPAVIGTNAYGQHLAQVRLAVGDSGATVEVTQLALLPSLEPDVGMAQVIGALRDAQAQVRTETELSAPPVRQEGKKETRGEPSLGGPTSPPTTSSQQAGEQQKTASPGKDTEPSARLIVIGENLRLGMPLKEAMDLLGAPQDLAIEPGTTAAEARIRLDYPQHGLVLVATAADKTLHSIEVRSVFRGQFAAGIKIGDSASALLQAYGMPAVMTPQEARYPDQGLVFKFDDAKLVSATVSLKAPPEVAKPSEVVEERPKEVKPAPSEQATAPPATQETPPKAGPELGLPGGKLTAVLAKGVTETGEPVSPTREFPEGTEKLYLVLQSQLQHSAAIEINWIAAEVEGFEPNQPLTKPPSRLHLPAGQRGRLEFRAPKGGFPPGGYRVELGVEGSAPQSLPFKVTPLFPPAVLAKEAVFPRGFNIALAALGGKIEHATSEYDQDAWAVRNLIDGRPYTRTWARGGWVCTLCGWSSKDRTLPQDIVFSFSQTREALVTAVVIDTTTWETLQHPDRLPKHVEIWTSTTGPTDGFTRVTAARLHGRPAEHLMPFAPTRARYVKVRLLSNYGGSYTQAGEVKIIEALDSVPSILADLPKNLALPVLGGAIVWFMSQDGERHGVHHLIDDRTDTGGWRTKDGYLPQEVVFAFREDRPALIDRIELNPKSHHDPSTWPKRIAVAISTDSPLDGFQEVGQFSLRQEPRDQAFAIGRRARFVKLRILETFGGGYSSLGEVKLIEGAAVGYESILRSGPETSTASGSSTVAGPTIDETGFAMETEPNNAPTEASRLELGRFSKGVIDPLGEQDYFRLTLPDSEGAVLTTELLGQPYLRTSLTFLDPAGKTLYQFDPGTSPTQRTIFSLAVAPGDHLIRVTEPPVSMVLIWDTSGSMEGSTEPLRRAMEAYLDQVRPSERLNLIRFSDAVEELLPAFTSDRERLKAAVQGKFFAVGGTALYDAIAKGIELLAGERGNRAIVVMTDGADSASRLHHPGFWKLLAQKRIRLYTIGLGDAMQDFMPTFASTGGRFLRHVALATNGRAFFAHTSDALQGLYQQITDELQALSAYYVKPTLSLGPGSLSVGSTGGRIPGVDVPSQFELILDASGSMKYQHQRVNGRLKIEVAKDRMVQIIDSLPDDIEVALRVYGRRIREKDPGDCTDTELLVPFGKIDKPHLKRQVRDIQALGTTPLAYSLLRAARDVANTAGEKLLILVTDGKEECGGSPRDVATKLVELGMNVRVEVVGFALADPGTKKEMEEVAEITGGCFFDAPDSEGLRRALEQALAASYDVLDAAGTRVGGGVINHGATQLPEGVYTIAIRAAGKPVTIPGVRIARGQSTRVEVKKEGEELMPRVLPPTSEKRETEAREPEGSCPRKAKQKRLVQGEQLVRLPQALERLEWQLLEQMERRRKETVEQSAAHARVRRAQQLLTQLGFDPGGIDGVWGRKTAEAITRFQRRQNLQPTGTLDDQTAVALQEAAERLRLGRDWAAPRDDVRTTPTPPPPDPAERSALLLKMAESLLKADQLTTPEGTSAYDYYQGVLRLDPGNAEAKKGIAIIVNTFKQRGKNALEQQDYARAIQYYGKAIELDASDSESYVYRGVSYMFLGDHQQAIRDNARAIALDNSSAAAYHNRGVCYAKLSDYQQAIRDYTSAIALSSGDKSLAASYHARGQSYHALGSHQQAFIDYQRAARLGFEPAQQYLRSLGMRW
jgi:tetratricopeptide (TPR) repeat protein/Mg-chelatase subunit ChlD